MTAPEFDWWQESLAAADAGDDLGARCSGDRGMTRSDLGGCSVCGEGLPGGPVCAECKAQKWGQS